MNMNTINASLIPKRPQPPGILTIVWNMWLISGVQGWYTFEKNALQWGGNYGNEGLHVI
jgi:hypothetical protein